MGLTRIIPAEEIGQAVEWDVAAMPVIGQEESLVRPVVSKEGAQPQAAEKPLTRKEREAEASALQGEQLEAALLKAREEGFSQGKKSGFEVGKQEGLQAAEGKISALKEKLSAEQQGLSTARQNVDET